MKVKTDSYKNQHSECLLKNLNPKCTTISSITLVGTLIYLRNITMMIFISFDGLSGFKIGFLV